MAQRGETRARMVTGAAVLFRERGVAGTALTDVVEQANAPRGSIYHHFPGGKAQLAAEATNEAGRFIGRMLSTVLAGDLKDAVTAFIDFFRLQLPDSDFTAGCPVAAGALEFGEAPEARDRAGETFTAWESTLATALWQHGIPVEEAEEMATATVCAIEGALILARAQRSTRPLDRVEAFLQRQVRAITAAT